MTLAYRIAARELQRIARRPTHMSTADEKKLGCSHRVAESS